MPEGWLDWTRANTKYVVIVLSSPNLFSPSRVAQERLGKPLPIRQEGQGGVSADQRLEMYLNSSSRAWARVKATTSGTLRVSWGTNEFVRVSIAFAMEPSSLMSRCPFLRASFRCPGSSALYWACRSAGHGRTPIQSRYSASRRDLRLLLFMDCFL